jgi:hypothetical protein
MARLETMMKQKHTPSLNPRVYLIVSGIVLIVILFSQYGKVSASPRNLGIFLSVAAIALILFLWKIPQIQLAHLKPEGIAADRMAELVDKYRGTWAQVIAGMFFLVTGYFSWLGAKTAEEGQFTDRFTKAVQLFSTSSKDSNDLVARVGGIYELERLAQDSPRDHWSVMEVLTAYLRQYDSVSLQKPNVAFRPQDVQAILYVIGRRDIRNDPPRDANVFDKHLDLGGINLQRAFLQNAHLEDAWLVVDPLDQADLRGCHLERANLDNSTFAGANLENAHLEGARLHGVHLEGAVFKKPADGVPSITLGPANLNKTHLEGVDLTQTVMTRAQFDQAITDQKTIPPHSFAPAM